MVIRDFKKFVKRRGRFVRQPRNDKKTIQRSRDDKNGKGERKCFRCGDPNHLIGECPKSPRDKNQRTFVGGSWSDSGEEDDEKIKDKACLICLGVNLEPNEWIKDSRCSKHMTGNRKLFSTYKAYNGGKIYDNKCRVTFSEHDSEITKDGKVIGRDPIPAVRSYGGNRYTLVIVNDYSRLVAQGYNQQEGIDYDETYAPVARLESIRILLAYACALDFKLFQMDVKSAFLDGFINEEFEMRMMGELNFFHGLQIKQMEDGIFFNQSKYIKEMLKKFGLEDSKPMKTPMSSDTKLTRDEECESIDSTKYQGMISSLLYLTASRSDIMFSVYLFFRFQEAPKISHLEAIKRIFRYIKGTTPLGLWYPKGTDIETVVYADFDHAGDYVDRKSTSGGHRDHVSACLCRMLYCTETSTPYNLAFFILKRMEKTQNKLKELLPYGMLLTRLFKHVMFDFPELAIDHYLSRDRVMHPLAPHYERKTRSDHGKKRPHESNASSSSTTLNHPSSSRLLDDIVDKNDEESFHSNSSFPSQNVSSSSNVVSRVRQNPPRESQHLSTYLSETINLQTQQRDAHREGLRTIRQALKDMMTVSDFATPVIEKNVTESLEVVVLAKSSSQLKSTYEAATQLSEFERTKILMDKMDEHKSYLRADYKKELYDALVKSYNTNKYLFESYVELFTSKRSRYDKDKDQDPSARSDRRTKRRKSSKETESSIDPKSKKYKSSSSSKGTSRSQHKSSGKSTHVKEPSHTVDDSGVQRNQEFDTGNNDEQPDDEAASKNDGFKKPERPLTLDPDWNKRQHVDFRPPQTWISDIAHAKKSRTSFDELIDTPIDFSAFVLNRLNITNLTQELLVGPSFYLLKGTCKSHTELEYHFKECFKAIIERLDWHNPENKQYLFDLRKPLPLIPDRQGRQVIPLEYFINNNLVYLKGGDLSRKYSTSVTKTKAATYELLWIEDIVPTLWSPVKVVYDKHAYWGTSHWGPKRQRFYGLKIMKLYDYGHLDEIKVAIEVRREDRQLYMFKEGNFPRLRLQDIEDMLLLLVQQTEAGQAQVRSIATCSYPTDILLKLKNFKKDEFTSFQDKQRYEHVGPNVTSTQDGKRSQVDDKRLCLVDDLKKLKITYKSSLKEQAPA
ncbi:retrovirus-related pol polyprotein from transposon TNT 1-94 [Tanacetum coccineum]